MLTQYAVITPKILMVNSIDRLLPRSVALVSSECHTYHTLSIRQKYSSLSLSPSSPAPTYRNRSSIHPIPQASNNPTHDHLRNTIGRSLQDRANSKDDGSDHDHPASTKQFAREEREAGAEETPDFVDGNHGALEGGTPVAAIVGIDFRERLDECVSREYCLSSISW